MSKLGAFAKFTQFMAQNGPDSLNKAFVAPPSKKLLKRLRPPRYKRAFSMGFRGLPKEATRLGSTAAPTIDQVRARERKYGQRIHVKQGLMFFKTDGAIFTTADAEFRQANG